MMMSEQQQQEKEHHHPQAATSSSSLSLRRHRPPALILDEREQQEKQNHKRQHRYGGGGIATMKSTTSKGSMVCYLVIGVVLFVPVLLFVGTLSSSGSSNNIHDRHHYDENRLVTVGKNHEIRIFGPSHNDIDNGSNHHNNYYHDSNIELFTREEQRQFLFEHGSQCWIDIRDNKDRSNSQTSSIIIAERFDALPIEIGTELWKYCFFKLSLVPTMYWDIQQVSPTSTWEDILLLDNGDNNGNHHHLRGDMVVHVDQDYSISYQQQQQKQQQFSSLSLSFIHPGWIFLAKPSQSIWVQSMITFLMETTTITPPQTTKPNTKKTKTTTQLMSHVARTAALYIQSEHKNIAVLEAECLGGIEHHHHHQQQQIIFPLPYHCPLQGSYCCQVWNPPPATTTSTHHYNHDPVLMIKHPLIMIQEKDLKQENSNNYIHDNDQYSVNHVDVTSSASATNELAVVEPYLTSIQEIISHDSEYATTSRTSTDLSRNDNSNFMDLLIENNCLPKTKECHMCMKRSQGGCEDCFQQCPCYCRILCKIKPPEKPISGVYQIVPPMFYYNNNPSAIAATNKQTSMATARGSNNDNNNNNNNVPRRIPKIIHQTWYEPITKEKYPNMSRLIESWKSQVKYGWEYNFYNDFDAIEFIKRHFPPSVYEAYNALLPGAFKADLFRYCVLLIKGGVYADMDVLLESNLDTIIKPNVGFMTPLDEPGSKINHRHCLWNGFLAVAPGHPIIAKTIEIVVNNIRNRFTSLDYDNMLCPNPVLSISHSMDLLFVTGPCILGTVMNQIAFQRHPQAHFSEGEYYFEHTNNNDDIPGSIILLRQDKEDMGAHRFTLPTSNSTGSSSCSNDIIVCSTDLPDYDDRPKEVQHYSKTKEKSYVYGLSQLYKDNIQAGEEIRFVY